MSLNLNVYSQSNETGLLSGNVIQTIPENPSKEENDAIVEDEELISENTSTSGLDEDNDNQNSLNETSQEEGEVVSETSNSNPDGDCLFDPSLPKCAPDENGNCPEGFYMNGYEQCFPAHDRCPSGYHSHEDDESGRCIPDNVPL